MSKIIKYFKDNSPGYHQIHYPYILAEAGVNHEGNIDLAKRLIDEASEGGAQGIKFQTYKAEFISSRNSPAYWDQNHEPTKPPHQARTLSR